MKEKRRSWRNADALLESVLVRFCLVAKWAYFVMPFGAELTPWGFRDGVSSRLDGSLRLFLFQREEINDQKTWKTMARFAACFGKNLLIPQCYGKIAKI